jgi:DNA-binding Lrp family transcriptional regulator
MPQTAPVPTSITDPINRRILEVSEDSIAGFHREPFAAIATASGVDLATVLQRIRAMLEAGTIRRVRQTLLATNLAPGALVAWQLPADKLESAFDWMCQNDPFTGHVVIRSTDPAAAGASYRLWTTVKVPQGYSLQKHCEALRTLLGADAFVSMPARRVFRLGVGHMRRKNLQPGDRTEQPGTAYEVQVVTLTDPQWAVLVELKRELDLDEIVADPWSARAANIGLSLDQFCEIADQLMTLKVIGRFSTFLEHVKKLADGSVVSRYNALFHWAVPEGHELAAGCEVGRHVCMTHAYWRPTGDEFRRVNIMGVAHGSDQQTVLAHKAAIDEHLAEVGIPVSYTNVFWGGRSEIKPSEISPLAYQQWCKEHNIDLQAQRA